MNKSSFTRLIQNPGAISDTDMLALEQVVQAFGYCHTAHMLLAKASHDKGSMMAPQRLRKAAIHAPSRSILKKLIESAPQTERQMAYARVLSAQEAVSTSQRPDNVHLLVPEYHSEIEDLIDNDFPESSYAAETEAEPVASEYNYAGDAQILPITAREEETTTPAFWAAELAGAEPEEEPIATLEAEQEPPQALQPDSATPETEPLPQQHVENNSESTVSASNQVEAEVTENAAQEAITGTEEKTEAEVWPHVSEEEVESKSENRLAENEIDTEELLVSQEPEKAATEEAPAEEKAIETGDNSDPETDVIITNQEPAEAKNSAVTEQNPEDDQPPLVAITPDTEEALLAHPNELTLEQPVADLAFQEPAEAKITSTPDQLYTNELIRSIYQQSELGYAMSSSRMGECLQRKSELTTEVPFHFQPELLVEYTQTQTEETESEPDAVAAQQEIINDFLKQASKGRNRINQAAKAEEQEDLSSKSTKLNKSLVSENLAQIFAMQGKNKKAIKIYQQLQLKIPEKKDYFAAQIVKLQNIS